MAGQTRHDPALVAIRETRAVSLRAMGMSYDQIAASLLACPRHAPEGDRACTGCRPLFGSRSGAKRAVDRALAREYAEGAETREQMRRHQLSQIDTLLQRAMRDSLSPDAELRHRAMLSATRLLDRRAKLLGLDAPTRVTVTDELDAQIAALVEQLTETPA